MDEFPNNSHRAKEAQEGEPPSDKKIVPIIVEGAVVRRKQPLARRFMKVFFGGDARGALGFVVQDVLLPAAKDAVADALREGVERVLFGEERARNRRPSSRTHGNRGPAKYVSYNQYAPAPTRGRDEPRRHVRGGHKLDEILFAKKVEAETVLRRMYDLLESYDQVTVADFYELVNLSGDFTDNRYGWTELFGSRVMHVHDGFVINLPAPEPLAE